MAADNIEVTESKVTYTTKELLIRIDDRFDRLERLAADMPTRAEFSILTATVQAHDDELAANRAVAKALKENNDSTFTRRDKLVGAVLAVLALTVQVWAASGGPHP